MGFTEQGVLDLRLPVRLPTRDELEADRVTVLQVAAGISPDDWYRAARLASSEALTLIARPVPTGVDRSMRHRINWGVRHISRLIAEPWRDLLIEAQRRLKIRAAALGVTPSNAEELLGDHASALSLYMSPIVANVDFVIRAHDRFAGLERALSELEARSDERDGDGELAVDDGQLELF